MPFFPVPIFSSSELKWHMPARCGWGIWESVSNQLTGVGHPEQRGRAAFTESTAAHHGGCCNGTMQASL